LQCEAGKVNPQVGSSTCTTCEELDSSVKAGTGCLIPTSGIRAAVDAAAAGAVTSTLWEAGTGVLAQTWSEVDGWDAFYGKAGTLQCTDVDIKCTIDAQASSSSDRRRVLYVRDADGVFLIGLIVRRGYLVSWGDGRGFKRHPDACTKLACAALPPPTPPKSPNLSHP
jgi:hypothetical protein